MQPQPQESYNSQRYNICRLTPGVLIRQLVIKLHNYTQSVGVIGGHGARWATNYLRGRFGRAVWLCSGSNSSELCTVHGVQRLRSVV